MSMNSKFNMWHSTSQGHNILKQVHYFQLQMKYWGPLLILKGKVHIFYSTNEKHLEKIPENWQNWWTQLKKKFIDFHRLSPYASIHHQNQTLPLAKKKCNFLIRKSCIRLNLCRCEMGTHFLISYRGGKYNFAELNDYF